MRCVGVRGGIYSILRGVYNVCGGFGVGRGWMDEFMTHSIMGRDGGVDGGGGQRSHVGPK